MLASASGADGAVSGSRDAIFLPTGDEPRRVPWEQVASADWDSEEATLTVVELAPWGEAQPRHLLRLEQPDRLLQLVRERVTASIVLQRHVPLGGRRTARIVGRRPPSGRGEITWLVEYDAGADPADPAVRATVGDALDRARADIGEL
ncbi:hypothetical protein GCM10022242_33270 [Nocardioides panacisoli]|uniref:SRPBCC family protein n=1 Tax=Nocardioides panacisoli TaxID=627624 RepID=A0ABP7IXK0_9ACTN